MRITHLSLFSGIGGIDLAAEWAGFKTVAFVEIDKYCQKVLKRHWPTVPIVDDIRSFNGEKYKGTITLITGGDPCQPRSVAGKRRGKADDRDLWKDMFRVLCDIKPAWVVNENPTGRLSMDFHETLFDLESAGYETRSFVIPACAVNAPHQRERLFIVAYSPSIRRNGGISLVSSRQIEDTNFRNVKANKQVRKRWLGQFREACRAYTDTAGDRLEGELRQTNTQSWSLETLLTKRIGEWDDDIPTPIICRVGDGVPDRTHRIKALGNAVVPQQIYPILKAIADIEQG